MWKICGLAVLSAGLLPGAEPLARIFERASAALAAADYPAAEQGFNEVLKSSPNHIGALGNLGVIYSRTERPDRAIDCYRRALKLSPRDRGLLLNLGLAYLKQEAHTEALPVFRQLLAAYPKDLQARELLATS